MADATGEQIVLSLLPISAQQWHQQVNQQLTSLTRYELVSSFISEPNRSFTALKSCTKINKWRQKQDKKRHKKVLLTY